MQVLETVKSSLTIVKRLPGYPAHKRVYRHQPLRGGLFYHLICVTFEFPMSS